MTFIHYIEGLYEAALVASKGTTPRVPRSRAKTKRRALV